MNRYHLQIITHSGSTQSLLSEVVEADDMSNNSDGFYRFSNRIKKNNNVVRYQTIACYPIVNTIVEKIEYNINK